MQAEPDTGDSRQDYVRDQDVESPANESRSRPLARGEPAALFVCRSLQKGRRTTAAEKSSMTLSKPKAVRGKGCPECKQDTLETRPADPGQGNVSVYLNPDCKYYNQLRNLGGGED